MASPTQPPLPAPPRLLRFRAWPLSLQVILTLAGALLPLGALAMIAAMDNYANVRASQAELMSSQLIAIERTVQARLDEDFALLRAELASDASTADRRIDCSRRLDRLAATDPHLKAILRLGSDDQPLCASTRGPLPDRSPNGVAWQPSPGRLLRATKIDETSPGRDLVIGVRDPGSGETVLGRISRDALTAMIRAGDLNRGDNARLLRYGETIASWGETAGVGLPDLETADRKPPESDAAEQGRPREFEAVDGGRWLYSVRDLAIPGFRVLMMRPAPQLTLPQALTIALPVLLWLAAIATGWLAIRELVVQPLLHMRRALDRYAGGDPAVRLGGYDFRTQEMHELGDAFDRMADQISSHEEDLRSALATQKKLTREVHHRVKNNLQIVSSLLSLQSRDAASPDVAYAYATIQKRVNALALVHRWLYDDDAMRGVDLRSLAQDLCAGLEQSVTSSEIASIAIVADVERVYVGQDTAVPLAFLITELVTAAARLSNASSLAVRVGARSADGRATLRIEAPSFKGEDAFALGSPDPSARIVQGMARQMRTKLLHFADRGAYTIDFPVGAPAGA